MRKIKLVPHKTTFRFVRLRRLAFVVSSVLAVLSVVLFFAPGLNYGIDFQGGILIEVKTPGAADLGRMRSALGGLGLGEVALQEFGGPDDVLIRIERQAGDATAQQKAVDLVKEALAAEIGGDTDYRRVEFVGPKVSAELIEAGTWAVVLAVAAMLVYIWLRFEWQFSIGAVAALVHDVVLTIGMFAATGLEFNLSTIAAILTIIGYSMNDTVVVYDRVRENLRRYKTTELKQLLDLSINDTLARTTMTSFTTLLALLSLFFFGGEVIRGFTAAMIWGVFVGTYSSIFVAAPILMYLGVRREQIVAESEAGETS
jgi:preprotein translocase SecF subunit